MKYYIRRDLNEYGPYSVAELQRYVAQGNIAPSDLARAEGATDCVPVSQVLSNTPPGPTAETPASGPGAGSPPYSGGVPPTPGAPVYSGAPGYPNATAAAAVTAVPQDFHWALVLIIGILTCGIFFWVWFIVEAAFVKKIRPQSNGLLFAVIALACSFGAPFFRYSLMVTHPYEFHPFGSIIWLASFILVEVAAFTMKDDLEQYYNSVEPINLRLNPAMVFFFAVFYFQHHFSRISRWKKTGILAPQG
ncbi:MAG TPA: GYF domain-containing protein [Candidatus Angelobacter sp.]|nr:GYF domain-containing protein [Candidatus Angelobacter sp.]